MNSANTKLFNILKENGKNVDISQFETQASLNKHLTKLARPYVCAAISEKKAAEKAEELASAPIVSLLPQDSTFNGSNFYKDRVYSVCAGDSICFERAIFENRLNGSFLGYKLIEAVVLKESYGQKTGQHTFTLLLNDGSKMLIKGRNLYSGGVYCSNLQRDGRKEVVAEKNERSRAAAAFREENRFLGLKK